MNVIKFEINFLLFRLFGFKIHPMGYQIQAQAAAAKGRSSSSRQRPPKVGHVPSKHMGIPF